MAQSRAELKLLTLNTHSWQEKDNEYCLRETVRAVLAERPDVIALQEVNQRRQGQAIAAEVLKASGFVPGGYEIVTDNWALELALRLAQEGQPYHWTWAFAHNGYPTCAEGIALMSLKPIEEVRCAGLSLPEVERDKSWRNRRALAICTEDGWFCSTHTGWWEDEEDPFRYQWEKMNAFARSLGSPCWMMGDFNSPAHLRDQGYDLMIASGWHDCFARAEEKDSGVTVPQQIDGWRDQPVEAFRLDLCLADRPGRTLRSRVIFNGSFHPVVSDHFGVLTVESV